MIAGLFLIGVVLLGFIVLCVTSDGDIPPFLIFVALVGCIGGMIVGAELRDEGAYKKGQVDALTGKIQYKLKTNPDSTKTWEKVSTTN